MRHFWVEIEKAFASKAFSFPVSTFSISLVVLACFSPYVVKINRIMLNFSQDDRETKKVCGELLLRWPTFESPFYLWSSSHWGKSRIFVQKNPRLLMKTTYNVVWIFAPKIILKKWNIWIFALNLQTFFIFVPNWNLWTTNWFLTQYVCSFLKVFRQTKQEK